MAEMNVKTIVLVSVISILIVLFPLIYLLSKSNMISRYFFKITPPKPMIPTYNPPLLLPSFVLLLYCGFAYGIYTSSTRITPAKRRPVAHGNVEKIFNNYGKQDGKFKYIITTSALGKAIGKVFNVKNHLTTEELQVYMDKYQKAYPKLDENGDSIIGSDGTRIMIKDQKIDLSEFQTIIAEIKHDSSKHMVLCIISLLLAFGLIAPTMF